MLRVKVQKLPTGETIQMLQRKRRIFGWKTLDSEEVPGHVLISLGCLGDTGGWVSKFTRYGSFGRDGIMENLTAEGLAMAQFG